MIEKLSDLDYTNLGAAIMQARTKYAQLPAETLAKYPPETLQVYLDKGYTTTDYCECVFSGLEKIGGVPSYEWLGHQLRCGISFAVIEEAMRKIMRIEVGQ